MTTLAQLVRRPKKPDTWERAARESQLLVTELRDEISRLRARLAEHERNT